MRLVSAAIARKDEEARKSEQEAREAMQVLAVTSETAFLVIYLMLGLPHWRPRKRKRRNWAGYWR
jgi:hypothetical protein